MINENVDSLLENNNRILLQGTWLEIMDGKELSKHLICMLLE